MKKLRVLVVVYVALLMLFAAVAPAFAGQPKLAFNNTNFAYPDPNNPGTQFIKDNILHQRNQGSVMQVIDSPWGVITTTSNIGNNEIDLTSLTGSGVSKSYWTCSAGSYDGAGQVEFTGYGFWVYHGVSFTVTTNSGGTFAVDNGELFAGIIFTGQFVGKGTINNEAMQMRVTFTGVAILDLPGLQAGFNHDLSGDTILTGITTYWFTG